MKIQERIEYLTNELNAAINSKKLTYEQTKEISDCGIYLISKNDKFIYIGKTNRTGKVRLRELAVDYRSHTFNKKILRALLSKIHKKDYSPLKRDSKKRLIEEGVLTLEEFIKIQSKVNDMIKTELDFQFYKFQSEKVLELEHFAIAVLNPKMND